MHALYFQSISRTINAVLVYGIGVYDLPIDSLREPPDYLRVREVKEWFVEHLVGMLKAEDSDHEDLTAPLLVIASCTKEEFKLRNVQKHTYEVGTVYRTELSITSTHLTSLLTSPQTLLN